jgi:carbon monoxide dehydrogenase subunit G
VFQVDVPIEQAWQFLSDMQNVGRCVPGCESVRVLDERRSQWVVRAELGPFSRMLAMEVTTTEFDPPNRGAFLARGKDMETRGGIDLVASGENETQVTYVVEARALGFVKGLMEGAISLAIQAQADQFAANVRAALAT